MFLNIIMGPLFALQLYLRCTPPQPRAYSFTRICMLGQPPECVLPDGFVSQHIPHTRCGAHPAFCPCKYTRSGNCWNLKNCWLDYGLDSNQVSKCDKCTNRLANRDEATGQIHGGAAGKMKQCRKKKDPTPFKLQLK